MNLLPEDPPYELLHTRRYEVRSYRKDASTLLMRGAVQDVKPAGMYIADDPDDLTIHRMIVELEVVFPNATITRAEVLFEDFPHLSCTSIVPHYEKLVGLSVSRGFLAKVRELFGGPRGCTHVTALLQAMAPVVNQSAFSMRALNTKASGGGGFSEMRMSPEHRQAMITGNINTCHVWEEHGEHAQGVISGDRAPEVPVWITKRFAKLGRDPGGWAGP